MNYSPISIERRREILRILVESTVCESCGAAKKLKQSHCRSCYMRLPPRLRKALYRGFGDGYEEAFEESLVFLKNDDTAWSN